MPLGKSLFNKKCQSRALFYLMMQNNRYDPEFDNLELNEDPFNPEESFQQIGVASREID